MHPGFARGLRCFGLILAGAALSAAQEPAPPDTLSAVLARAGAYVKTFERDLSGIVAEEHYVQETLPAIRPGRLPRSNERARRLLRSDLLLVRPVGAGNWIQFRDVFEVDGRPVRDRTDRLHKLFLEPSASTASQAQQIVNESSRYNIGDLLRTINVPVMSLAVLHPGDQPRFKFKRLTVDDRGKGGSALTAGLPSSPRFAVAPGAWVIQYDETEPSTIIRTTAGRDLPVHGRFWIEPASGRVLLSELIARDNVVHAKIAVSYQSQPLIGLLVPIEMREEYLVRSDGSRIFGTATYTNFRQFQVKVDEKIGPIKEK